MAGPLVQVNVRDDEVILALQRLPRKVQTAVMDKLETIMSGIREDIFQGLPGKYLDPTTIRSGVLKQGSSIIGYIESTDKSGHYEIVPVKAKMLRFIAKDGEKVVTQHVWHPYLKGSPLIASKMAELKPWIEDQIQDALIAAL
jgi:hypothetical protein